MRTYVRRRDSSSPPGRSLTATRPFGNPLPARLKTGIERLSGVAMDDVRVHYDSPRPAQVEAHAYARGNRIHLARGQEEHLPHEAWHVVQQKQRRVPTTAQLAGVGVSDDSALEREAKVMGARALTFNAAPPAPHTLRRSAPLSPSLQAVQRLRYRSQRDTGLTVRVDATAHGVFAQAVKADERYGQSSLEYELNRYRGDRTGDLTNTAVPMATQTNTMHSDPERLGIGAVMLAEALEYLHARHIRYFQPDRMSSPGGRSMKALVAGTWRDEAYMARLIAEADAPSGGFCSWLKSCLCCFSSGQTTESTPLLEVSTPGALEVDYATAQAGLSKMVTARFDVIED